MGVIHHSTLIVASSLPDRLEKAHEYATKLLPGLVTPVIPYTVNGGGSFAVMVDGSKEGWPESDSRDHFQKVLINWMKDEFGGDDLDGDRWNYLEIAEVKFGEDRPETIEIHK
jgi:hypothetical protein